MISITSISRQAGSELCPVSVLGSNAGLSAVLSIQVAYSQDLIQTPILPYSFTWTCHTQTEPDRAAHAYTSEDEHAHAQGALLPTAPIKVCAISEMAAVKSQPRAHLFKRENNEFFVASHLPITINLAFCRYRHRDPYYLGL